MSSTNCWRITKVRPASLTGCLSVHVKAAAKHGATREEIAEALAVAISLNTGAALTYTAHALDAFDALPKP